MPFTCWDWTTCCCIAPEPKDRRYPLKADSCCGKQPGPSRSRHLVIAVIRHPIGYNMKTTLRIIWEGDVLSTPDHRRCNSEEFRLASTIKTSVLGDLQTMIQNNNKS